MKITLYKHIETMLENISGDIEHYKRYCKFAPPLWVLLPKIIYSHPASIGVLWYRFGQAANHCPVRLIGQFAMCFYYLSLPFARLYSGVQISLSTSIGPGLAILHFGGVVIANGSTLGANCLLHHNVNLVGYRNSKGPQIGNSFYAGVGVTVVDQVTINDNVVAGAGSIITKSVPENAVVAGVPARILRFLRPKECPSENHTRGCRKPKWLVFRDNIQPETTTPQHD